MVWVQILVDAPIYKIDRVALVELRSSTFRYGSYGGLWKGQLRSAMVRQFWFGIEGYFGVCFVSFGGVSPVKFRFGSSGGVSWVSVCSVKADVFGFVVLSYVLLLLVMAGERR